MLKGYKMKKGYIVENSKYIDEIKSHLIELTNKKTKARIVHIKNKDPENLFSISFQTIPKDNRGAPHILEHIVLTGSKKFPTKDPFFSMIKRSLNTFMNAFTGPDFTCYMASSEIEKDFYNLLTVYLDALFFPQIKMVSFLQESCRLEFTDIDDPQTALIYKGVVYNEMKGAMSSINSRLSHEIAKRLMPDLPYSFNSGGDPKKIPDLTHKDLKRFHKTHYTLANSIFYFYGDIETEKHLNFLEKTLFNQNIPTSKPSISIKKQKRFSKPLTSSSKYPTEEKDLGEKDIISFSWLTTDISNQKDLLSLILIDSILSETDASYLNLPVLQSKLCKSITTLLDTEISEIPWTIICRGCKKTNRKKLLKLIIDTLKKIKIPPQKIEAAMQRLEFSRYEITKSPYPYGLELFLRACLPKQHGCKVEDLLKVHSLFKSLKKDLKKPLFLEKLIKKYIIDNKHLVIHTMTPDNGLAEREHLEEMKKLKNIKNSLKESGVTKIIEDSIKVRKLDEKKNINLLPKLDTKDIPKNCKNYPLEVEKNIFFHPSFTNDIIYVDLVFSLPSLTQKELQYLPILTSFITEVGAAKRSYIENLEYIEKYLGGINAYIDLNTQALRPDDFKPEVVISGKALYRNAEKLFSLIKDMAYNSNFEEEARILELLKQNYTHLSTSITDMAMNYSILESQSFISPSLFLTNRFFGLPYMYLIKNNLKDIKYLIDILKNLSKKIFNLSKIDLVITSDKKSFNRLKKDNFFDILKREKKSLSPFKKPTMPKEKIKITAKKISSPVAFTTLSMKAPEYSPSSSPYILLASYIAENRWLIPEIRERGGAYGARAIYNLKHGSFYLYSYRDPNLKKSVDIFKKALEKIAEGRFEKAHIDEAKLQAVQKLDRPISPGKKAITSYSYMRSGITLQLRKNFRKNILNADKKKIQKAVETKLLSNLKDAKLTSFSSPSLLKREIPLFKRNFDIQSI